MIEVRDDELELLRSTLSHDVAAVLRTVASTLAYVEQLGPDQRVELLRLSTGSIEGVERVARQLLGLVTVLLEPGAGVTQLDELVAGAGRDADVRVEGGSLGLVSGPRNAWETIFDELLSNARRYGAAPITVARKGDQLTVSDGGPGLAPADRDRVFEPGVRLTSAVGHPGAGLGLYVARRMARALGGDLRLERGDPTGTAAVVRLPSGTDQGSDTGG